MDIHLDLEEEELEYLEEMGILDMLTSTLTEVMCLWAHNSVLNNAYQKALKSVILSKPADPMLSLVETMGSMGEKSQTLVQGKYLK